MKIIRQGVTAELDNAKLDETVRGIVRPEPAYSHPKPFAVLISTILSAEAFNLLEKGHEIYEQVASDLVVMGKNVLNPERSYRYGGAYFEGNQDLNPPMISAVIRWEIVG
jgi:hypothetical protein